MLGLNPHNIAVGRWESETLTKEDAIALKRDRNGCLAPEELQKLCSNPEDADIVFVNFYAAILKDISNGTPDCYRDNRLTAPEILLNDDTFEEDSEEKLESKHVYIKGDYITITRTGVEMAGCKNTQEDGFEAYYRSDMWSVGCIIFMIFSDYGVFDDDDDDPKDVLRSQLDMLGKMPENWTTGLNMEIEYGPSFIKTGNLFRTIERKIKHDEGDVIMDIIYVNWMVKGCLKWDPKQRASTNEISTNLPREWMMGKTPMCDKNRLSQLLSKEDCYNIIGYNNKKPTKTEINMVSDQVTGLGC